MKNKDPEFEAMHKLMVAYCERKRREGWANSSVERHAERVRMYLWECANNNPPHPTAISGLAFETAALARAQAAAIQ